MLERFKQWIRYYKWKQWIAQHECLLLPAALVFGVFVDFLTFKSIQIQTTFLILGGHVLIAATAIIVLNTRETFSHWFHKYARLFAPFFLQFSFGALMSASLIFYWFSGTFSVSWPVLLLVAGLMVSNEVFRHLYLNPRVQFAVFFFGWLSVLTLLFPFFFQSVDAWIFFAATGVALLTMFAFFFTTSRFLTSLKPERVPIALIMIGIASFMTLFYELNLIPPIPLSVRDAGVYHQVSRAGNGYVLVDEQRTWLEQLSPVPTIHIRPQDRTYVYTAIFAPTNLNTRIFHEWEFFDESRDEWVERDRLSFGLSGGRQEGFRGYSLKSGLEEGKWRVNVETPRGQVIARVRFIVKHTQSSVPLLEIRK